MTFTVSTIALLVTTSAIAKKPDKPGGGDGKPYYLVDLGGFVGGDFVQAEALDVNNPDDMGVMQVVGYSHRPVPGLRVSDAAVWDVTGDGQTLDLINIAPGIPGNTSGWRVNDLGYVLVSDMLWVPDVGYVSLPGLGGGDGSARLMDDQGSVFGSAPDADGIEHAVKWQVHVDGQVSAPVVLGDMGDFFWSDVNNNGVFAGWVANSNEAAIAWFDEQAVLQIQSLGKLHASGSAYATCINDNGMVAGETYDYDNRLTEGFAWTSEAGMISLGSFNGLGSQVNDLNNRGQIVGWSRSDGRYGQVAFLWQDGQMSDLNDVTDSDGGGNWIQVAGGINDTGHIAALLHLNKPTSQNHAALLVPNGS